MYAQAIEKIEALCAQREQPVRMAGRLDDRFYVLGGQVREMPPPLQCREFLSLDDLICYATENCGDAEAEVWYNERGATLLPQRADSRLACPFKLKFSRAWELLTALGESSGWERSFDQRGFIQLLQFDLRVDPRFFVPFRRMDWKTFGLVSGEVGPTRDRMGREITAQVTGESILPEEIPVEVRIFDTPGEREPVSVVCDVDISAANQRLTLRPNPELLAQAVEAHLLSIRNRLVEKLPNCGVYFGAVL